MEDVLDVSTRPRDPKRPLVCRDEISTQVIGEVRSPLPPAPGQPARDDAEDTRKGVCNLFRFFEPLRGDRTVRVTERRTEVDWAHAIKHVVDVQYPEAEAIVLVMDQLNTHRPASLDEAFAPAEAKRLAGKLEIHSTYTLTIIVQMGTSTPFQNCASLSISDANLGNNQSCVNVTPPPPGTPTPPGAADLAVQKTGQCNWPYTCVFTITVTNVGSAPYSGSLTVTDQTTPAWTTLLAGGGSNPSGPSCTYSGTAVVCSKSSVTLGPGQSQTFTFNVYFGPTGYRQPFTNCASLPSSTDSNPANNQGCLTLQPPPTATPTP
jgi:hypothetical protein